MHAKRNRGCLEAEEKSNARTSEKGDQPQLHSTHQKSSYNESVNSLTSFVQVSV